MISTEQFTARCDDAQLLHETQLADDEQRQKELMALCALTGYRAELREEIHTGQRWITVYDDKNHIVTQGPADGVLHDLVADRPWENDAPFGLFQEMPEQAAPVDATGFLRGLVQLAETYVTLGHQYLDDEDLAER